MKVRKLYSLLFILFSCSLFSMEKNEDPRILLEKRIKDLPKDMNLQIAKLYFSNLIKRTDFQSEKELIDSLNEFNQSSKATNQVVREYLKEISQTDQKYANLIVAGDPIKTFSKQFTALKLDLIDKILKNIMKADNVDLMSAVAKFEAYNFSKYKSKTDSNYSYYLNESLLNRSKMLYSRQPKWLVNDEQLLKLGADPNWLAPEKSVNVFSSGPAFFVCLASRYSSAESIDLMLKYGANPNLSNPDNKTSRIIGTPLHVLVGAATHKYENNEHVVNKTYLLLKQGANPMLKGPAGKSSLEYAKEKLKEEISKMSYMDQGKYYSGLYKGSPQVIALNKIIDLMNNADKIRQDFLKQSGQTKK